MQEGKDIRVSQCEDSHLYIANEVETLSVSRCVNCTIFVSAVARVCSLDRCENVTICCAANLLRIGSCIDCTVYTFTTACAPVIFGDTRSLVLAPHNSSFPDLANRLKNAGLSVKTSEEKSGYFSKPILMRVPK